MAVGGSGVLVGVSVAVAVDVAVGVTVAMETAPVDTSTTSFAAATT